MDTGRPNDMESYSVSPYWLSPVYRQALIVDAFTCVYKGCSEIPSWMKARPLFGESVRLLTDYVRRRLPRVPGGHTKKHQIIWEIFIGEPPRTIVEVGSYDGLDALTLSRMFPSARIFAFEADPSNFKGVKQNVAIRKQITPIPQAVLDFTGPGLFHPSQGSNTASGSMLMPAPKFNETFPGIVFDETVPVDTTTLLEWSKKNSIDRVEFVWMDAQGAELHILRGMEELLNGVQVILLEVWKDCYYEGGGRLEQIQGFLEKFGLRQTHLWMTGDTGDALFQKTIE